MRPTDVTQLLAALSSALGSTESFRTALTLILIGEREGKTGAPQQQLMRDLAIPQNPWSMHLKRLKADGWITSERSPANPSARLLRLTPKARAALKSAGL